MIEHPDYLRRPHSRPGARCRGEKLETVRLIDDVETELSDAITQPIGLIVVVNRSPIRSLSSEPPDLIGNPPHIYPVGRNARSNRWWFSATLS